MTNLRNLLLLVAVLAAPVTQAQAPVEERGRALQQGQQRAGMAYRDLEQARYDAKLAEQAVFGARDAHAAAQQQATLRQRELDAAQKALTAARARVAAAEQAYEKQINAVDAAHRAAPQGDLLRGAPAAPVK